MENNNDISKPDFFKHMFSLEEDSKHDLMNLTQFSFLSFIPIILLSKLIDKYIPKPDDSKSNLEIVIELIIQIILLIIGTFFTLRFVNYFPTYSGKDYCKINLNTVLFTLIFVVCMLDDIIVEKVNQLMDRAFDLYSGNSDKDSVIKTVNVNGKPVEVKITPTKKSKDDSKHVGTTSLNNLPNPPSNAQNAALAQNPPNFNNMYQQDTTPLVNASTPGSASFDDMNTEPMAANDSIGGFGGFSSW
jgi:type II secretory pathway pseudopilin PulG